MKNWNLKNLTLSIRSRDQVAMQYIYTTFGPYCINRLINRRNCRREDAEDLFVDAVLIFRDKILQGQIKQLRGLKTYLYKICENNFLAELKRSIRNHQKEEEITRHFYANSQSEEHHSQLLQQAALRAWGQLTDRCQDILHYFYVEELRMEEIAELMDLSGPDVAKTTKSRCFKKLMQLAHEQHESIMP